MITRAYSSCPLQIIAYYDNTVATTPKLYPPSACIVIKLITNVQCQKERNLDEGVLVTGSSLHSFYRYVYIKTGHETWQRKLSLT